MEVGNAVGLAQGEHGQLVVAVRGLRVGQQLEGFVHLVPPIPDGQEPRWITSDASGRLLSAAVMLSW